MSEGWTTPDEQDATSATTSGDGLAFQVKPIPFEIAGTQYRLSAAAAQTILKEVNRLPSASYPSAEDTARQIDRTLRDASNIFYIEEQIRTLLVAIERIRLRSGRLPAELGPLREALRSAPEQARDRVSRV